MSCLYSRTPLLKEEIIPPLQERIQQAHPLSSSAAHLFDVRRPGKKVVQGHTQITNDIDPINWLSEKVTDRG